MGRPASTATPGREGGRLQRCSRGHRSAPADSRPRGEGIA
jgi:hypothetical protein